MAILNPIRCASNDVSYRFLFQVDQHVHIPLVKSFCNTEQICNYKVASCIEL